MTKFESKEEAQIEIDSAGLTFTFYVFFVSSYYAQAYAKSGVSVDNYL